MGTDTARILQELEMMASTLLPEEDIAKLKCIQSVLDKAWSKLKARVLLETNHVD